MVTESHLANEDAKEVSTEGDGPLGSIPNAMSPNPGEDQNPLALEPRGICCDVCFLHAHFLLVNTILPQHRSWQGPA